MKKRLFVNVLKPLQVRVPAPISSLCVSHGCPADAAIGLVNHNHMINSAWTSISYKYYFS